MTAGTGDPVEEYLDELFDAAGRRLSPREGRRLLAEAEAHLVEAVAEGVAAGRPEAEVRREAVARFGPVRTVVRPGRRAGLDTVRGLVRLGWLLTAAGLVAVGVSGLVAAGMSAAFGQSFVGGAGSGVGALTGWSAAACRHFVAVQPAARGCVDAASRETAQDAVSLRLLAGVGGLLLLAGYWALGRRLRPARELPAGFAPTVGATVFGVAGLLLTGQAVDLMLVNAGRGAGFALSGGVVALAVAAGCLPGLVRALGVGSGPQGLDPAPV